MEELKMYIVYSYQNKEGAFGTGNCQYTIDEDPEDISELATIARDIESDRGWKNNSVVILNWHIWNTVTESKKHEKLKESYCRLVEECIHLKEQRDEAVDHVEDLLGWLQGDCPAGMVLNASDFIEKIKA